MSERMALLRRADVVFSIYIRRKNSIDGYCTCITCGKVLHASEMQNGHYIKRRHMATRFSELNCHPQCMECNNDEGHTDPIYREKLIEMYGIEIVEGLENLKNFDHKYSVSDLKEIIKKYKA